MAEASSVTSVETIPSGEHPPVKVQAKGLALQDPTTGTFRDGWEYCQAYVRIDINSCHVQRELKHQGFSRVHVTLTNKSEDRSETFVRIPNYGDKQVYHHRTGSFALTLPANFEPPFLYLEPGDSVEVDIYYDSTVSLFCPFGNQIQAITKEWLDTRSYQITGVKDLRD